MIYLIVQEGVYRHSIFGAFEDPKAAKREANRIAQEDSDAYHEYVVLPIPLNSTVELKNTLYPLRRRAKEADVIAHYRKET